MNRSDRKRRSSCVDDEVCTNSMISKRKRPKKLLTRPASLEIRRLSGTRKGIDSDLSFGAFTFWVRHLNSSISGSTQLRSKYGCVGP